jgi:hypothetical protein
MVGRLFTEDGFSFLNIMHLRTHEVLTIIILFIRIFKRILSPIL